MGAPRLLTPDEAGELLRCSGETVKRYVRCGELQAFRHRGRVLIPEAAIERFVEERLTGRGVGDPPSGRRSRATGGSATAEAGAAGPAFDGTRRLVEFASPKIGETSRRLLSRM